jgi:hypothetical protein
MLAAAALVVLAAGLGLLPGGPAPEARLRPASPGEGEVADFLARATPLLLVVANRDVERDAAAGVIDPTSERAAARRLAAEAGELRERLDAAPGGPFELVAQLERLFLQLANLPDRQYRDGLAVVRAAVERDAILFQLTAGEILRAARPPRAA